MRGFLLAAAAAAAIATPAVAQVTSASGSNSTANSGSVSGANNTNGANNNIGTSSSNSNSNSTANSGSVSGANSSGNTSSQGQGQGQMQGQSANNSQGQGQTQGQSANNSQGQMQGQDAHNTQGQMQGQSATNANGQNVSLTFNSHTPSHVEVKTNTPVGLTASSSFSSDYCGATASAGASAAPLGISIGASGPKYDRSCQSLRRAEKFGMAAANAQNMGQPELAQKLMSMMIWSICMADTDSVSLPDGRRENATATACSAMGLMGAPIAANLPSVPAPVAAAPATRSANAGGTTTTRTLAQVAKPQDQALAEALAH